MTPTTIDGVPMSGATHPSSIAELAEFIRDSASTQTPVYPVGGGTWLGYGRPPARPGVVVNTTGIHQIVDYPSEDLTITVEAGIRLAELERLLNSKNQTLPIAVQAGPNATLGGFLATASSGPRRHGFGTPRDFVLGLDVVDAAGVRIHGGGRVVKNVAGYDLPKMHLGAIGTLGVIVEATLKLKPLPEARAWSIIRLPNSPAHAVAAVMRSVLRPTAIEVINNAALRAIEASASRPATPQSAWMLALLFEDCQEAVDRQVELSASLLKTFGDVENRSVESEDPLLGIPNGLIQAIESTLVSPTRLIIQATVRPSDLGQLLERIETLFPRSAVCAHAGIGVVWFAADFDEPDGAAEAIKTLRTFLAEHFGHAVVTGCPSEWKQTVSVWGAARPEQFLMERLRNSLDPGRLLCPGRFVVD